jgi:hypothetical protein
MNGIFGFCRGAGMLMQPIVALSAQVLHRMKSSIA